MGVIKAMSNRTVRILGIQLAMTALLFASSCFGGIPVVENIDFTWQASAQNDVVFDATQLVNGKEITSFHWDFGDGESQTTTQDIVHHQYAAAGDYTVTLTGTEGQNSYTVTHTASASP